MEDELKEHAALLPVVSKQYQTNLQIMHRKHTSKNIISRCEVLYNLWWVYRTAEVQLMVESCQMTEQSQAEWKCIKDVC